MVIYRWISVSPIVKGCNLSCDYCYLSHHKRKETYEQPKYRYSMEHMLRALSKERLGGVCMFNICADGESLFALDIEAFILGILKEGHYVSIVTNGTPTREIEYLIENGINHLDHLVFKCSLHYPELKKKGLLKKFADNIQKLKEAGVAYTVECVACDDILSDLEEIKTYCMTYFGALPHLLTGRSEKVEGEYNRFSSKLSPEEYAEIWNSFDSKLFAYQLEDFELPYNDCFCYAGEYSGILSLETGSFVPCPGNSTIVCNMFEDLDEPIKFAPVAKACPLKTCFMSHVFNGLCGDCYEDKKMEYSFNDFRNRVCVDGSEWLSPTIKDVYCHRCSEAHEKLDEEAKVAWTSLMKKRYNQKDDTDFQVLADFFAKRLQNMGIQTISIYGFGNIGKWFYEILKKSTIKVISAIDINSKEIVADIPVVGVGENTTKNVDAIIVSIYDQYASIISDLKMAYPNTRFFSLIDII